MKTSVQVNVFMYATNLLKKMAMGQFCLPGQLEGRSKTQRRKSGYDLIVFHSALEKHLTLLSDLTFITELTVNMNYHCSQHKGLTDSRPHMEE